jgi:hypothetical protein
MQLSNQAIGAIMLALQNSLMDQSDIVPVLKDFVLAPSNDGLIVSNPPIIHYDTSSEQPDLGE